MAGSESVGKNIPRNSQVRFPALMHLTRVHETMRKYASYDFVGVLNADPDLELLRAVPRIPANRVGVLIRCSSLLHNSARSQTWTRPQD